MRLVIPIQYGVKYSVPRRRGEMTCYLAGEAPVHIRDVAPDEARVAFVVADTSPAARQFSPIDGRARRVIQYGGSFWRELMDEASFREMLEQRCESADEFERREHDNPFARGSTGILCWIPGLETTTREALEQQYGIRQWRDDGGAESRQQAQLMANDVIAVGSRLFMRCEEPCWRVSPSRNEVVLHLDVWSIEGDRARRESEEDARARGLAEFSYAQRYSLGRHEDALQCARELASLLGAERVTVTAKAKVVHPTAAAMPDDCIALEQAVEAALRACGPRLGLAPREAARAWYALRDTVETVGAAARPEVADALARVVRSWQVNTGAGGGYDALSSVLGTHALSLLPRTAGYDRHAFPMEGVLALGRLALWRWARRPADGREWTHLAGPVPRTSHKSMVVQEVTTLAIARRVAQDLGIDLDAEASEAADGRVTLVAASEGDRFVAYAALDRLGAIERTAGPGGRPASRLAAEAMARHAAAVTGAPEPDGASHAP